MRRNLFVAFFAPSASGKNCGAALQRPLSAKLRTCVFVCMTAFGALFFIDACRAASLAPKETLANLQKQIAQEQARAKARRDSLIRLTQEERVLNKDLAAAEDGILRLEADLTDQENKLAELAASDAELRAKGDLLLDELAKTEEAMSQVLRVLWELHAKRQGVGGRDLPDWHVTDREHIWSVELFSSLDEYRKKLADQRDKFSSIKTRRVVLHKEAQGRAVKLNKEKEELLQRRMRYSQLLADLRKTKQNTEEELSSILALVRDLNLRLEAVETEGDMAKAKGGLPWPVKGKLRQRFNPSANPPVRGVTVALGENTPVRAVHWGKVVHNDVLRGIGRVVILMHGEEYYSLYAFLSESSLHIGQEVARGDVIGVSGFVTNIEGPGLYFELRFHQKAINPEQWLRKS